MPRNCIKRCIKKSAEYTYFKPKGVPLNSIEEVIIELDEFEAIRLADQEEMYHAEAAEQMGVSRQTFGNILKSAHQKVADAIINGKAILINNESLHLEENKVNQRQECCRKRNRG